jgi:serine/threonine protein kinase/Tol biopolymer transport system component
MRRQTMNFAQGQRLGPYEIVSPVGAGGMGEVYKARDVRLNRTVAIKVLPARLRFEPDLRQRLIQEAQTIAALDHPHICVLHDIGSDGDTDFLVMEYLDGETLAMRLEKAALPIDQMLRYAIEVGSALARAHRQGVIHRDLKPGNIMLTKSGAKLLDFGLAKLQPPVGVALAQVSSASTKAAPLTSEGSILGTLQYMAPEQLDSGRVDARTDIFAFGAVMYEMATQKKAFVGDSQASLIAAILEHSPPPISAYQPAWPRAVNEIIQRCLSKDPEDRWQTASDLTFALSRLKHDLFDAGSPDSAAARPQPRHWRLVTLAVASCALLLVTAYLVWTRSSPQPLQQPPAHLLLSRESLTPFTEMGPMPALAMSRDGQLITYVAEADGTRRLFLRNMQVNQATAIAGTENASQPFFSPDGRRIGFFADGYLKVVATEGGAPIVLANTGNARGGTWALDNTIIYSPGTDSGLWQVPATGGTARQLIAPDSEKGERSYRWPTIAPGGEAVVFTLASSQILSFDDARLVARSLRTGEQRELIRGGTFPVFAAPDLLLYSRAGALLALPWDAATAQVRGTATTVLSDVITYPVNGGAQYAVGSNGTLVYAAGGPSSRDSTLTWVDRAGTAKGLNVAALPYNRVSVSRDGRHAALDIDGANAGIWILDLPTQTLTSSPLPMTRLTLEWSNNFPFWTPDGTRVGFLSAWRGVRTLFWQSVDGGGGPERLVLDHESDIMAASAAPDGHTFMFEERRQATGSDLWLMSTVGDRIPRPFLRTSFNEQLPQFSPDGQWVAYVSDESGSNEVFVQPYPGPGRKWRVTLEGGEEPAWAADGRELFFWKGDAMMAAKVAVAPFATTRPEVLFRRNRAGSRGGSYAVAPDGRFLIIDNLRPPHGELPASVVLNWLPDVRRRLTEH